MTCDLQYKYKSMSEEIKDIDLSGKKESNRLTVYGSKRRFNLCKSFDQNFKKYFIKEFALKNVNLLANVNHKIDMELEKLEFEDRSEDLEPGQVSRQVCKDFYSVLKKL